MRFGENQGDLPHGFAADQGALVAALATEREGCLAACLALPTCLARSRRRCSQALEDVGLQDFARPAPGDRCRVAKFETLRTALLHPLGVDELRRVPRPEVRCGAWLPRRSLDAEEGRGAMLPTRDG